MKGVIGIATADIGRYRAFDQCLYKTEMPEGTRIDWQEGNHISGNFNAMCRTALEGDYGWLWILDDDHVWHPSLLRALLERDVDIVFPLCVGRSSPWYPVVYEDKSNNYENVSFDWLNGKSGLVEVTDKVLGNGFMLIKRNVLEVMGDPWFEDGKTSPGAGGCDLYFCQKALDLGIKLHVDLENITGHLTYNAMWPERGEDGMHRPVMHTPSWIYTKGTNVGVE